MMLSIFDPLRRSFRGLNRWVNRTPNRALEQAYEEILKIKAIEDEHFDGETIAPGIRDYSDNVYQYFRSEVNQHLRVARVRLAEFRLSQNFLRLVDPQALGFEQGASNGLLEPDAAAVLLEKLRFVDEAIARYEQPIPLSKSLVPLANVQTQPLSLSRNGPERPLRERVTEPPANAAAPPPSARIAQNKSRAEGTSFVPRSILGTFDRLRRDLDPDAEQEMVQSFRLSRAKTALAVRFLLILVIMPLLTHHLSKTFFVGPLVDHYRTDKPTEVVLSQHLEEEALGRLATYREHLEFEVLTHQIEPLSPEELEEKLEIRADSIFAEFKGRGGDAVKNVFADLLAVIAFMLILLNSPQQIAIVKSFMDELVYGLSDSAKAFIIILFTDIFVGFHSPHGWEIILEGIARHFGLPESRDFIFLFIATFPVILDTVFKYWIFRYLNRISPSAVATYRNMNE